MMAAKTKYTQEERNYVLELVASGLTAPEAAKQMNIKPTTVYNWIAAQSGTGKRAKPANNKKVAVVKAASTKVVAVDNDIAAHDELSAMITAFAEKVKALTLANAIARLKQA